MSSEMMGDRCRYNVDVGDRKTEVGVEDRKSKIDVEIDVDLSEIGDACLRKR
jgi:hypothetical protein